MGVPSGPGLGFTPARSSSGSVSAFDYDRASMGPKATIGKTGYGNPVSSTHVLSFSGTGMDASGVWGSPALTLTSMFTVRTAGTDVPGFVSGSRYQKVSVSATIHFDQYGVPTVGDTVISSANVDASNPYMATSGPLYPNTAFGLWNTPVSLNYPLWEVSGSYFRYYGGPWRRLIKVSGE